MIAVNGPFYGWMMDMLRTIANLRSPFLDKVMSAVTFLGHETVFIVIAAAVLFCYDKRKGYKTLFMFSFGVMLSQALKFIFRVPRPWVIDPEFQIVESARAGATSCSLPSGHTLNSTMLYFGTAKLLKRRALYFPAAALVFLVGFSRMYLGVHTLLDVLTGLAVGVLVLVFTELLFRRFESVDSFPQIMLGIAAALNLVFLVAVPVFGDTASAVYTDDLGAASTLFGLAFGAFCGSIVEKKFIRFDTKAVRWVQLIKIALAIGIMLGVRAGTKPLFALISDSPVMNAPRYFLMALIIIGVYPFSFRILALLGRKKDQKEPNTNSVRS